MKEIIIDLIKRNRISTTEVADCMDKTGAIKGVNAINRSHFRVGSLRWVYAVSGTNWDVHKQLEDVEDGDVVFVEALDNLDKAIFGELASKYVLLYKQASAIFTNGLLRDAHQLIKENWPIWCKGFNPVGYENIEKEIDTNISSLILEKRALYDGAIAVCDDTGVVIIPKDFHNENFVKRLHFIEEQEDIWFDCIDRKKMTTFETVCLKKYLKENNDPI